MYKAAIPFSFRKWSRATFLTQQQWVSRFPHGTSPVTDGFPLQVGIQSILPNAKVPRSPSLFLSEMDAFPKLPIYPFSPLHEQGSHSHSQAFLPDVPLARRGVLKSLLRPHGIAQ